MVNPLFPSAAAGVFFVWAVVMSVLYSKEKKANKAPAPAATTPTPIDVTSDANEVVTLTKKASFTVPNTCAGAKIDAANIPCMETMLEDSSDVTATATTVDMNVTGGYRASTVAANVGPQAGANVTKGYEGSMDVGDLMPITAPYYTKGLCPVNVHWHLGAEHYSAGEYDCVENMHDDSDHGRELEQKCGPSDIHERRRLAGKVRQGFQCNHYDEADPKFTKPYEWKYCDKSMEVGQTYEVHWPHSAAGACGTPNQYQTPFYDGVFCNLPVEAFLTLGPQDIASAVGVQAQIYTIVNDEDYYYPDLIKGMIVEGDFGADMAIYTGSTTGTTRDNEVCSQYTPITWQVDRKCHLISASSFDKMCADMMTQNDDMSDDTHAHGSRELVSDPLAANNQQNLRA